VIHVALNGAATLRTARHEAIHWLRQNGVISDANWRVLEKTARNEGWIEKFNIRERYQRQNLTEPQLLEEAIAEGYAEWAVGGRKAQNRLLMAMRSLKRFFDQVRAAIRRAVGRDTDFRDLFSDIESGTAGRTQDETRSTGTPFAQAGQREATSPRYELPPDAMRDAENADALAEGGADARQSMMMRLLGSQPLDRLMRLPFDIFGGVNEQNEWAPGHRLSTKAERIIAEANFSPDGRMAWMNPVLHKARAGLIDRYGLDPAYVERDRRRGLDERKIAAQVPELMKALQAADIGATEARVLQAVLTGEQVADAEMAKLSEPIRNAIDTMGMEAVQLGLLSPEAYERNRGAYLHRVYLKHETDQNSLSRWVSRLAGSQRKKIIGNQFKGRGLWLEASAGAVLRNTDAAETLRDRSGMLRLKQRRREVLISRLERAMIQADERSSEMLTHLKRRFDLGERVATGRRRDSKAPFRKPTSNQRGRASEQGAALGRLRNKAEQAERLMAKIASQLVEVDAGIVETETKMLADSEVRASAGDRFTVLDRVVDGKVVHRVYAPAGGPVPDRYAGYVEKGVWEVRGLQGGKVVLWRDFTKAEREQMGEIVDARYTITKTYMGMAHDLANGRFYKDIAENPEWSTDQEPASGTWKNADEYTRHWVDPDVAWVRVPDTTIASSKTKRYAAMAGRWVRSEIWRDIQEIERMQTPGWWDAIMRQWKLNKTARSPVTHMNNIMSNVMFMDIADVRVIDLVEAIRSMATRDAHYQDAVEHGTFGTDIVSIELRQNVLEPILADVARDLRGGKDTMEAKIGIIGRLVDAIWGGAKSLDRKMVDLYRLEDEVFRMATYVRKRETGYPAEEAAKIANEQFLNYDIRAPWVNAARRSVLPFLSYTYRAVPVLAKSLALRPWKLAKYATVAYALNAIAYMVNPGDEDEERRSLRPDEQGITWIGAPRMLRLPWADSYENPVFLDVRRWIPAGDVFDANQGQSAVPVPAWLQFGGPLMIAAELALNKQGFTGREITNEYTDTAGDKAAKVGDYLWKSWMPSAAWVPGSWYWDKIGNAVSGARDYSGRPYSVPQAVASSVGIKIKPQDVAEGFYYREMGFDRTESALKAEARRYGRDRDRGLISQDRYDREIARIIVKGEALSDAALKTFEGK